VAGEKGENHRAYEVSIRYEGTELGTCALESEGAYISGKWVAESAQWPTLLQGLVPLSTVVIQEPQHQRQEVDRIAERETKAEPRRSPVSGTVMLLPSMARITS
jgi:hypothetical protein